jgi:IclR family acetate operon transcriptional repressor
MSTRSAATSKVEGDVTGPRSLTRLLALFSLLSRSRDGLPLAELNAALDTPKSSLLNLLRPLVAEGYLLHDHGAYRLGPSMFRLSAGVMAAWNFPKTIRPFMEELALRTQESVLLGVLNREAEVITYVEIIDGPHPVRYQIPAGTTRPLYASAAGRMLLAYADEEWSQDYLSSLVIKAKTAKTITRASLKREIETIRKEGYAWSVDAYMVGLSSVVAPVFDGEGRCIASLGIAGPSDRLVHNHEALKTAVQEVAARASGVVSAVRR